MNCIKLKDTFDYYKLHRPTFITNKNVSYKF